MKRTINRTSVGDFAFDAYEPLDGQVGVLAQQIRIAQKPTTQGPAGIAAMALVMDIFNALIVHDEDRDHLYELLVTGQLELMTLFKALLNQKIVDAEVVDAAPQTVVRRSRRSNTAS